MQKSSANRVRHRLENPRPANRQLCRTGKEDRVAAWGLHLIDMDLAVGNLIQIASRQAKAWSSQSH